MDALSKSRPIFRSEDDFQEAFKQEIQRLYPGYEVIREYTPSDSEERIRIDLWVKTPQDETIVIELKYPTKKLDAKVDDIQYNLVSHDADDLVRHDFLKDVERVENLSEKYPNTTGYAIIVTNVSLFWRDTGNRDVADSDFRIYEGKTIHGSLSWGSGASSGTTQGRERPLEIKGRYTANWQDYSAVGSSDAGKFRFLLIQADTL